MPPTLRGVYHNLKESKYVVSNGDITFFFSSEHTLNKFMNGYENYRGIYKRKSVTLTDEKLNLDTFADIDYYRVAEKRGFYVWLKGIELTKDELSHYGVRKLLDENSPVWERIDRPKVGVRFG